MEGGVQGGLCVTVRFSAYNYVYVLVYCKCVRDKLVPPQEKMWLQVGSVTHLYQKTEGSVLSWKRTSAQIHIRADLQRTL